ncbi:MAG: FadR family transcriptional regulator [Actinomycetales bacterium]|nr:FadR family transcriptional regulator [Actinomycetales bacterium]
MSDRIVATIIKEISSGQLSEGESVPTESALSASFSVSRSVVREAVRALSAKGFVVANQGSSTVVAPRIHWNVLDPVFLELTGGNEYFGQLIEAREALEPRMAYLAAQRISPQTLNELDQITRLAAERQDAEEHARLDLAFHEAIAMATENAILSSLNTMIAGLGHRTRSVAARVPGAIERGNFWHLEILNALRAGDAVAAESAMRLHMRQVRGELMESGMIPQLNTEKEI